MEDKYEPYISKKYEFWKSMIDERIKATIEVLGEDKAEELNKKLLDQVAYGGEYD